MKDYELRVYNYNSDGKLMLVIKYQFCINQNKLERYLKKYKEIFDIVECDEI